MFGKVKTVCNSEGNSNDGVRKLSLVDKGKERWREQNGEFSKQ